MKEMNKSEAIVEVLGIIDRIIKHHKAYSTYAGRKVFSHHQAEIWEASRETLLKALPEEYQQKYLAPLVEEPATE